MTKKGAPTWEEWWARNRFKYIDFPDTLESASSIFPFTPSPGIDKNSTLKQYFDSLKIRSINLIHPMLKHRSHQVRGAALMSLGMLNNTESYQDIINGLKDPNQSVKDSAMLALAFLDDVKANHTLFHLAQNTDEGAKFLGQTAVPNIFSGLALSGLVLNKVKSVDGFLRSLAVNKDMNQELRGVALECIGLSGGETSAKFLADYAVDERSDPVLRSMAVNAMSRINEPFIYPYMVKLITGKHMEIRCSAALGLGLCAGKEDDRIAKLLYRTYCHTTNQSLKAFSLLSMGMIGGEEAKNRLMRSFSCGQTSVIPWSCIGLGLVLRGSPDKDEKAVRFLTRQLEGAGNRSTRGAAAVALGLGGVNNASKALVNFLNKGDDPYFRGYCAIALGLLKDNSAIAPLVESLLNDGSPQVKIQAAAALAYMRQKSTSDELLNLFFKTPNMSQAAFLGQSLGFMGDIQVVTKVLDKLEDSENIMSDHIKACSIILLSKLLSGKTIPYFEPLAADSNFASEYPLFKTVLAMGI